MATMPSFALAGARLFDGDAWHDDAALLIEGGTVAGIVAKADVPDDMEVRDLDGESTEPDVGRVDHVPFALDVARLRAVGAHSELPLRS